MPEDENKSKGFAPVNRPLTPHERDLVRWLLDHGNPGSHSLVAQIDRLTVVGKCTCGCPTVDFAVDGEPVARKGETLISDHLAEVDGKSVGVMLFETGGKISSLEVYSLAGTLKSFGLPAIDSLFPWEDLQNHTLKP